MSPLRSAAVVTAAAVWLGCAAGTADRPVKSSVSATTPAEAPRSIYFIMVDRFANGDRSNDGDADPGNPRGWHGGDLRGIIDHLDYLEELGVSTLWLSPVFASRSAPMGEHGAYHGYWTYDLEAIDPRFGTEAELRELGEAVEHRGMELVLDLVVNHVGYEAPLISERPQWFHREGTIEDWSDEHELVTGQVHGLPDLAQENEEVYEYLLRSARKWLAFPGVRGFRLDAVKHVDRGFWRRFLPDLQATGQQAPLLIGEIFDGAPAVLASYAGLGFTHVFDFALYYAASDAICRGKSPMRIAAVVSADTLYASSKQLIGFADNHDLPRVRSACSNPNQALGLLATAVLLRELPAIQYGTESGLVGEREPDNRRDMEFRDAHGQGQMLRRLLAARKRFAALHSGTLTTLRSSSDVYAVVRAAEDHALVLTINNGARGVRPLPADFPAHTVERELIADAPAPAVVAHPGVTAYLVRGDFSAELRQPEVGHVEFSLEGDVPDSLVLGGSHPALGAWSPGRALSFVGGSSEISVPVGSTIEYKLGVARPDGTFEWESGTNRYLFVRGDAKVTLRWRK